MILDSSTEYYPACPQISETLSLLLFPRCMENGMHYTDRAANTDKTERYQHLDDSRYQLLDNSLRIFS